MYRKIGLFNPVFTLIYHIGKKRLKQTHGPQPDYVGKMDANGFLFIRVHFVFGMKLQPITVNHEIQSILIDKPDHFRLSTNKFYDFFFDIIGTPIFKIN